MGKLVTPRKTLWEVVDRDSRIVSGAGSNITAARGNRHGDGLAATVHNGPGGHGATGRRISTTLVTTPSTKSQAQRLKVAMPCNNAG